MSRATTIHRHCWFHRQFGIGSAKCIEPCHYNEEWNLTQPLQAQQQMAKLNHPVVANPPVIIPMEQQENIVDTVKDVQLSDSSSDSSDTEDGASWRKKK